MANLFNNPKHWRNRAEEARAIAESLANAEAKRIMNGIAEDYERLAKRAEARLVQEALG